MGVCILFSCQLVAMCKCANDAFCPEELLALEEEEEEEEEGVYNRKVLCAHSREQEQRERERERTGWGGVVVVVYLLQ